MGPGYSTPPLINPVEFSQLLFFQCVSQRLAGEFVQEVTTLKVVPVNIIFPLFFYVTYSPPSSVSFFLMGGKKKKTVYKSDETTDTNDFINL